MCKHHSSGTLVATYLYDPDGNLLSTTGNVDNPWRYASGYLDSSTGLYKFGARYYDPTLGRWTQQDPVAAPLGDLTSLDRYVYAGDDPVNVTDPSGKDILLGCVLNTILAIATTITGTLLTVDLVSFLSSAAAAAIAAATSVLTALLSVLLPIAGPLALFTLIAGLTLVVIALLSCASHLSSTGSSLCSSCCPSRLQLQRRGNSVQALRGSSQGCAPLPVQVSTALERNRPVGSVKRTPNVKRWEWTQTLRQRTCEESLRTGHLRGRQGGDWPEVKLPQQH